VIQNLFVACNNAGVNNYYRKYQGYGSITRVEPSANSIYNSLQIGVRRSVGDLTLSASYTYSHSIDDSSDRGDALFVDPNNPSLSRGSSNFDIRHAFTLSYVYALPFFKAPGIAHTLLGGWQVSGITTALSGPPFTLSTGSSAFPDNARAGEWYRWLRRGISGPDRESKCCNRSPTCRVRRHIRGSQL